MTTPAADVIPIFATPFARVPISSAPGLNPLLSALFLSRATEEYRDATAPRDSLCFRSREDLFEWREPAVEQLRRQMLGGICAAVRAVNRYTDAEFSALGLQTRARFVIVRPDGGLPAMSASMASWYALYCVEAPPPPPARADSGVVRLYAVREASMFMDAANCRLSPPFTGGHQSWRPVPGQMALFPASILHEVALNRTDGNLVLVGVRVRFAHSGQTAQPPW